MAKKMMKTWIAVAIAICLFNVAQGQFFRINGTTTTAPPPVEADGESAFRPQPPRGQGPSRDCRAAGATVAPDGFRGAEAGAAEARAMASVNADLARASSAFWVQTGCRVRRVTVPITRYFMLGSLRIRCTGNVQVGICFGYCRSYYAIDINNNAISKECQCCEPNRLRSVTQNVVLSCGVCLFYNYRFTSIQPVGCSCQ